MAGKTLKQKLGSFLIPKLPITRENFDILRFELNAMKVRFMCAVNPFQKAKIRKFTGKKELSVNIGAGPFGEVGWVNIDMFNMPNISFTYDCRKKLPFLDNTVKRIRCEHMLEHLDRKEEAPAFLKECLRCLMPGGIIRIIVPDVKIFIDAYHENTTDSWARLKNAFSNFNDDWLPMDVLNHIFRQDGEHKYGYDFETLKASLTKAGFTNVTQASYKISADPQLLNDQPNHQFHSLYVEAFKA